MEEIIQTIVTGLLVGVSYAILAAGLSLIFGVLKIINFTHGNFVVLGMYFPAFFFLKWLGIDPFVSAFLALPIYFVFGYIVHRLLIEKTLGQEESSSAIMTLGFALVLSNLMLMVWTGAPRMIDQPYTTATWSVGNILINQAQGYSMFIALILIAGLFLFLNRTLTGKAIRAAADDPEGCAYMGINVNFVYALAFAVGTSITAAGGCLLATYRPFDPFYGGVFTILLFCCVILGGLTSLTGAVIGGVIIGLLQQLSTLVIPVDLSNAAVFMVLLICLYILPHGLFGKKGREI